MQNYFIEVYEKAVPEEDMIKDSILCKEFFPLSKSELMFKPESDRKKDLKAFLTTMEEVGAKRHGNFLTLPENIGGTLLYNCEIWSGQIEVHHRVSASRFFLLQNFGWISGHTLPTTVLYRGYALHLFEFLEMAPKHQPLYVASVLRYGDSNLPEKAIGKLNRKAINEYYREIERIREGDEEDEKEGDTFSKGFPN